MVQHQDRASSIADAAVHAGQDVGVGVEGERDAGVSQELLPLNLASGWVRVSIGHRTEVAVEDERCEATVLTESSFVLAAVPLGR